MTACIMDYGGEVNYNIIVSLLTLGVTIGPAWSVRKEFWPILVSLQEKKISVTSKSHRNQGFC